MYNRAKTIHIALFALPILIFINISCILKFNKPHFCTENPKATLSIALRSGTYADVISKCLRDFEMKYDIRCDVAEFSEDALHKVVTEDKAGSYDLCMVDGSWMAEFTSKRILANLTDLGYELDEDIIPATKKICYSDGSLYLAPYYGNVSVLLVNKLMAKEAGFAMEEIDSIEDIQKICDFQKKRHNLGFMTRGDTENNIVVDFLPILLAHGGWVVDENNSPTIDTPEFKRAMETYMALMKTGRTAKKDDLIAAIANKSAAFAIGWPGWYTPTRNSHMDYIAFSGKTTKDGARHNASIYGIWTIGLPRFSRNKEHATKLLEYLMDKEIQKSTIPFGGVPCRYSCLLDEETLHKFPQYKAVCEALEGGVYRPIMEEWPKFYTILGSEMKSILNGEESISMGLYQAQRKLESAMMK